MANDTSEAGGAGGALATAAVPLLILRITLGLLMLQWTALKFTSVQGAIGIADKYYFIPVGQNLMYVAAAIELVIVVAFLAGYMRKYSYLLLFLFHLISTLGTIPYLASNRLFGAGIPVLAGFWLLYKLRDSDNLYSLDGKKAGG